jgi:hypothetical protein
MTLKYGTFESIDLPNDYVIIQPPAGLLTHINKRLDDYRNDNNGVVTLNAWGAVFILACLYKKHDNRIEPVCLQVAKSIADQYANTVCAAVLAEVDDDTIAAEVETNVVSKFQAIKSIRDLFVKASKDTFNEVLDELLFITTLEQLKEWFEAIDKSSFITKKTENDLKKATSPEASTGS